MRWAALGGLLCLLLVPALGGCGDLPLDVKGSPSEGIVFVRMNDGGPDLARGRIADGAVVALTKTPDREESWPFWSELSRRLAFQVGPINERADSDLVLWLPRTGQEIPVTRTPRREERWPIWSPTQQRLAFAYVSPQGSGLAVFDLEARGARLLTRSSREQLFLRPTFSPDGASLVVQQRGEGGRGSQLWRIEEGRPPLQLTFEPRWFNTKAWFTRDAKRIVYTRRPTGGDGWFEIAEIGSYGGEPRVLAASPESDSHSARPSPTRDEIVFVSDRGGDFDVYLMAADGTGVRNLTRTPERHEFAPRWSADGQRLLVTVSEHEHGLPRLTDRDSLEKSKVLVLDRDGTALFETTGFMPDWMPAW